MANRLRTFANISQYCSPVEFNNIDPIEYLADINKRLIANITYPNNNKNVAFVCYTEEDVNEIRRSNKNNKICWYQIDSSKFNSLY